MLHDLPKTQHISQSCNIAVIVIIVFFFKNCTVLAAGIVTGRRGHCSRDNSQTQGAGEDVAPRP